MRPQGPATTGIKVQPVTLDQDYKAPDGYVLQELMSARNDAGEIQFFAVLGILMTPEEQKVAQDQAVAAHQQMLAEAQAEEKRRQDAVGNGAAGQPETAAPSPGETTNTPPQA